jgi:MinD-like ATPase involved in chromosome partitioning or flagellar assembly
VSRAGGSTRARPLEPRDLLTAPHVDGRPVRDHSLRRFRRRLDSLLVSRSERAEVALEARLRAHPGVTRSNLVAVASPKGGVGKTAAAFLVADLLASRLKLRVVAVDASPSFGTLGSLAARPARTTRSLPDLLEQADRVATASELAAFVSRLPSGLHVLGGPRAGAPVAPDRLGQLLALLSCFYDAVLLDLGPGAAGPVARLAVERSDQVLLVTTPEEVAASLALHALDHLGHPRTTVVLNRTHPRHAREAHAVRACFEHRDLTTVTLPDDRRLALMLATGTYSLEALDHHTRLQVKCLGLTVADRLV